MRLRDRYVIDSRRTRVEPVVRKQRPAAPVSGSGTSGSRIQRWVAQIERAPAHVDPIVALVHRRSWSEAEDRIWRRGVDDTRRHAISTRTSAPIRRRARWRYTRTVAILAPEAGIRSQVVSARVIDRVAQY